MHWAAKLNHVNMKYDISSPKSKSIQRRSISIEILVLILTRSVHVSIHLTYSRSYHFPKYTEQARLDHPASRTAYVHVKGSHKLSEHLPLQPSESKQKYYMYNMPLPCRSNLKPKSQKETIQPLQNRALHGAERKPKSNTFQNTALLTRTEVGTEKGIHVQILPVLARGRRARHFPLDRLGI
jgi:hypothetical protein